MIVDNNIKFHKRWLYGYIPAIGFILLIFFSIIIATTYFLGYKSVLLIEQWGCEGKVGQDVDWDNSYSQLMLAKNFNPWDADLYMRLGDLYEWKAVGETVWNNKSRKLREDAMYYYREAIRLRPTWANAWYKYAQSNLLNRNINDDTYKALEMGFKYGKWQPEVNKKLIWMTIGIWGSVPENIRGTVRELVKYKLQNNEPIAAFAVLALRYKWFDELLALAKDQKQKDYLELVKSNPKLLKGAAQNSLGEKKNFVC